MNIIPNNHWLRVNPIAHRGFQDKNSGILENTMEACLLAVEKNYPIELDIRITKDGEIILLHDISLKRIAGINKSFSKITLDDIKNINLRDLDGNDTKCKIATLKNILEEVRGKVPLLIDIKFSGDIWNMGMVVKKLSELLSNYKGEYAIQSFYAGIYDILKKHNTFRNTYIGLVAPIIPSHNSILNNIYLYHSLNKCSFDFLNYCIDRMPDIDLINYLKKQDIPLLCWYITNKVKEINAQKIDANLIFADYEDIGYIAPKILTK